MIYVAILIFGFTIGNVYMLQSLLTSDVFGYVSFGAVYGLIAMATQISSGIGPWMIGALEDLTGSYEIPLTLVAILTYAALIPIYFAKPPTMRLLVNRLLIRSAPQRGVGATTKRQESTNSIFDHAARSADSTSAGSSPRAKIKPG